MSEYCSQNLNPSSFKADSSWVVLSPIEKRIKEKIDKVGKPLKNWDINIYRGILTGYNEAFIIDGKTKDALIAKSAKNAEIIRPILRGRDIKRHKADFADIWLLNIHNGTNTTPPVDINDYPEIKAHLDQFYPALEKRQDKGVTPYNLRSCIYTDDFSKQKIVWIELTDSPNFMLDIDGYYINNTIFFMTGEHLKYITAFLNSRVCEWYFDKICATSGVGTRRWIKMYIDLIRIPYPSDTSNIQIDEIVDKIHENKRFGLDTSVNEEIINHHFYEMFSLSEDEISFIELVL